MMVLVMVMMMTGHFVSEVIKQFSLLAAQARKSKEGEPTIDLTTGTMLLLLLLLLLLLMMMMMMTVALSN